MDRLGPFEVGAPLGRGGMGVVHRARFGDADFAVKVLTGRLAEDPRWRRAFRHEVRAAAALDHPGIVRVFDYGVVPPGPRRHGFTAGAPWLAMELVEGADLGRWWREGAPSWTKLRRVLLDLLGALAHAHARGVVHRDLKPSNVLVDRGGAPCITDFGIAHALDGTWHGPASAFGTRHYMPPEQIRGAWRDYGPPTDLYAVACVATTLCTGAPPFAHVPRDAVLAAHLAQAPRPLVPRVPVPEGFEAWLRVGLAKHPSERWRSAADAAWQLRQLGGASVFATPAGVARLGELPTEIRDPSHTPTESLPAPAVVTPARPSEGPLASAPLPTEVPFRRTGPQDIPGVGLGLWGLRRIPLVGREDIVQRLWGALLAVARLGRPRAVTLAGPAGVGKSRLASWLCQHAHELAGIEVVQATHSPRGGPGDGVVPMLERQLRLWGLEPEEARSRVRDQVALRGGDPGLGRWLGRIVAPHPDAADAHLDRAERHDLLARWLATLSAHRPIAVWVDDCQWGPDAVELVHRCLESREPVQALFVLTRRGEGPAVGDVIDVGPLPEAHRGELVDAVLGLAPALAERVEEATRGNPLHAVHLVGDWVERGILARGAEGFELLGDVDDQQNDLSSLWTRRIERALADGDPEPLELAAVLGGEVDAEEWEEATGASWELVEGLLRAGLVVAVPRGFAFSHGLLREALLERAALAGRLEAHHLRAGRALERRGADPARVGRHLLRGGHPAEAVEPLLDAAEALAVASDVDACHALLDEADDALRAVPPSDSRHGRSLVFRAHLREVRQEDPSPILERALRLAREHGWPAIEAHVYLNHGQVARLMAKPAESRRLFALALELAEGHTDAELLANSQLMCGVARLEQGDLSGARTLLRTAAAGFEDCNQPVHSTIAANRISWLLVQEGQLDEAAEWVRRAVETGERAATDFSRGAALLATADLARARGDLDGALGGYREAIALLAPTRHIDSLVGHLSAASVGVLRGDLAAARTDLAMAEPLSQTMLGGPWHATMLAVEALSGDERAVLERSTSVRNGMQDGGYVDRVMEQMAMLAAEHLDDAEIARLADEIRARLRG